METKKELLARLVNEVMHKDNNKVKGLESFRKHNRKAKRK